MAADIGGAGDSETRLQAARAEMEAAEEQWAVDGRKCDAVPLKLHVQQPRGLSCGETTGHTVESPVQAVGQTPQMHQDEESLQGYGTYRK